MNIINTIIKFLKESRVEIKKVNWLARPQLVNYTLLVIGFMVRHRSVFGIIGLGIYFFVAKVRPARRINFLMYLSVKLVEN